MAGAPDLEQSRRLRVTKALAMTTCQVASAGGLSVFREISLRQGENI